MCVHLCTFTYRGQASLPARKPGLAAPDCCAAATPTCLEGPPGRPPPGPFSPLFLTSWRGLHLTCSPGLAAACKALEYRGRRMRHQMSAGHPSKSSSRKVPKGETWTRQPCVVSSNARRHLCSIPGGTQEGPHERAARGSCLSTGVPGRVGLLPPKPGHHQPLRVDKPIPRSPDPTQTASANQTPQRDLHPQTKPLCQPDPHLQKTRGRSGGPQREVQKSLGCHKKTEQTPIFKFTRLY